MKTLFIFFVMITVYDQLSAQQNKADSLVGVLSTTSDTTTVKILNELTRALWYDRLDSAERYNSMALQLADSLSYQKGIAEANRCRGMILIFKGDSSSIYYLTKALSIFTELDDKRGIAATLNNQNNFYLREGKYSEALDALFKSLKLFNELQDKQAAGAVTNQIGVVYDIQNDYSAALDYFLKALTIRREIDDVHGVAFTLTRVGDMYFKLRQLPQALDYYQQSFKLAQTIDSNNLMINTALGIGKVYQQLGNYNEALNYFKILLKAEQDYYGQNRSATSYILIGETYMALKDYSISLLNFQQALEISGQKNAYEKAIILHYIGQVYLAQDQYPKALENCFSSLNIAKQLNFHENIKNASLTVSQIYAAMNDYPRAYEYHLQYAAAKDSVQLEDLNQRLAALQQSLELKNKQTQIDLLNRDKQLQESEITRQKQQRYAFIAGIILFIVLIIVLVSRNRQKQRSNTLLEEQKQEIQNTLSELKATQSQLIQSEKMASLGELTAGIAHEIQNPLNFVNNFSEVNTELIDELKKELAVGSGQWTIGSKQLAEELIDDIKANEEKIIHHGKRADAIVKGMLQHSRTSSGVKEPTDINVLCDEYLRLSYHGLRAKEKSFNAKFETDFDASLPKVNVVPQDVGRVVLNLINNAFYAVTEKNKQSIKGYEPTVFVSTKKEGNKISIRVKDNGNGIPESIKEKIFQPFFTTKPTGQGTGLGLSLSYDIIKAHGGELEVKSEDGKGTMFIIRLPKPSA